ALREQLDERAHLVGLVLPLGQCDAHVEEVRTAFDLLARDVQHAVVVVGEEEALDRPRSPGVDPLTHARRRTGLLQVQRARGARAARAPAARDRRPGAWRGRPPGAAADGRRDAPGRRAAATADDVHTVLRDDLLVRLGEAVRAERIDGDAAVVLRDARVRDHAD